MEPEKLKQVTEALIFASDDPITDNQIKSVIESATVGKIKEAIENLNHDYRQTNRAIKIIHVAGGYEMVTRDSFSQWVKELFKRRMSSRLSQAALETLSMVAFKQPVSSSELVAIRGVNSDGVLRTLLRRKLITISGRGEGPGRPLLYTTTKEFLRYFGINSIDELPKPREIEEILNEKDKFSDDNKEVIGSAKVDDEGNIVIQEENDDDEKNAVE